MILLPQSTTHTFRLGPFVDSGDGDAEENGLTIAYTAVLLSKAGGALGAKAETTNLTGTGANAHYTCILNTTDTNTLGELKIWCHISGALYVEKSFQIVPQMVYNALVAGSDKLEIDVNQVGGTAVPETSGKLHVLDGSGNAVAPSGEYNTQLDANMSTRAPSGEYNTEMARITDIRMAALTDWINGGRLDLLLDAVSTHNANNVRDAILADSTPFNGADIDASISSRGTADPGDAMALTGAAVDAILDDPVEGTVTVRQSLRISNAFHAGITTGGGTATINFRDLADTVNRIRMTGVNAAGNRTGVTLSL